LRNRKRETDIEIEREREKKREKERERDDTIRAEQNKHVDRDIHGVSEKLCKIVSIRTSSNFHQS